MRNNQEHYSINTRLYKSRMEAFCRRAGVILNINKPATIQDKLAWLNIYDEDMKKVKFADKVECKNFAGFYLKNWDIIPKTLGTWYTPEEIPWRLLPDNVMIKCNHGCAMNIKLNGHNQEVVSYVTPKLNRWLAIDYAFVSGFEAHYHDITHCIFAEEVLGDGVNAPIDYKFLCFNGEPKFMQVISNRNTKRIRMNYYDMDMQPCKGLSRTDIRADYAFRDVLPTQFEKMKEYARQLAQPFRFVRVDFYEVNGRMYLGEMTFTPAACGFRYVHQKDEYEMGKLLKL